MAILVPLILLLLVSSAKALETCRKECGGIEIPEPFSTGANCGDPRYKLSCDKGVLEFSAEGGSRYKVQGIDSSARTLTISPPEIRSDACYTLDFAVGGLRLGEGLPFNVSALNTVMLLNCTPAILRSPLNCSETSLCRRFEAQGACRGTLCCHFLKDSRMSSHFIRVRAGGCTAYTSVVDIAPNHPVPDWTYGIQLQWLPPN